MRKFEGMKKVLSAVLAFSMVLSYAPVTAFAVTEDGSCAHHTHDESCGYVAMVEGVDCGHECSDACKTKQVTGCTHSHEAEGCTYTPAAEAVACDYVHGEGCNHVYAQDEVLCTCGAEPQHTAECASVLTEGADCDCAMPVTHAEGCNPQAAVAESCDHVHGECAYREAVKESWSCGHVCSVETGCITFVCAHVCPEDNCGFVAAAGSDCEYVCSECDPQPDSGDVANAAAQTVDFMDYLEDPLAVMFQSAEDIDLHDYLVNAYGVPAEIPFTCEPATVAYGEYADGDTFSLSVTAGEGYEGSCTVEAEVRYLNPNVTSRVLTVTFRVYQGSQKVAEKSFPPTKDFNDLGYDYAPSWNITLQADTEYRLEVSWGPPLADGYTVADAQVVEMYSAGTFRDPADTTNKSLSVTNHTGMNSLSGNGTAGCNIRSDGFGTYAMHIALDSGDGAGNKKFKINLTFQASGKENDATSTVPQGTNISLSASTRYSYYYYDFSWKKNGTTIDGANEKTYTVATAVPGDVYVATISRKANDVGCTGSESWTHTFTVTNETFAGPTVIDGLVYNGSVQTLFTDGTAPAGYDVYYDMQVGDPVFRLGSSYEYFWDESTSPYVPDHYSGNAGTYTIRYFIANHGWYNWNDPVSGAAFQKLEEGTITCTIAQASPTLNAAPTAVTGLKFNGESHSLVNPGSATNGTVQYRLSGGGWSATIPTATDAGTYTVEYRIVGANNNYKNLESETYKVTTTIASADASSFEATLDQTELTYDGTAKKPTVSVTFNDEPLNSERYTVEYQNNTEAGRATAVITSPNWTGEITSEFTIDPKPLTNLTIDKADKVYNGTAAAEGASVTSLDIVAQDQGKVQITANIAYADANAGVNKTVTASNLKITGDKAGNYTLGDVTQVTGTGTISPMPITVTANNLSKTYGEADPTLTWYADPEVVAGETLTGINVSRREGEAAGNYTITVTAAEDANPNYTITPKSGTFTINPKPLTIDFNIQKQFDNTTGIDQNDTFQYTLTPNQVLAGDKVKLDTYTGTASFASAEVGENIKVTFSDDFTISGEDAGNYSLTQPTGVTGTIYNNYHAVKGTDFTVSPDDWTNGDVTITAAEDCQLAKTLNGEWNDTLTYTEEATTVNGNKATFYVKKTNGDISKPVEVSYFIDQTVPTGTIALNDREFWQELVSSITFGLFYNYEQTVTITFEDTLSGVAKTEYLASSEPLEQDALAAATWTEYTAPIPVALEDTKQFIYYGKITDKAGNVKYLSTDGAVYDTTRPEITGVNGGETYYITKPIAVTDTNFRRATLKTGDGEPVAQDAAEFDLPGNVDAAYTITATDKAGNQTTVSVTMKPIESLDDALDAGESTMTVDNVKLSDKAAIIAIRDQAKDLMGQTDVEAEDVALQQIIDRMDTLLEAIAAAEAVIDQIENLPAADKAEPDSEEHLEALLKAQADYEALTDNGKKMVGEDNKAKLDAVATALRTYKIIAGDGGKYTKYTGKTLSFTANGPVKLALTNGKTISFKGILVDGAAVGAENYTVVPGSTVVTLTNTYLDSLKGGKHTIVFLYDHMGVECKTNEASFRVNIPSDNPKTGDYIDHLLWAGTAVTCLLCMAMMIVFFPRKKGKYQR